MAGRRAGTCDPASRESRTSNLDTLRNRTSLRMCTKSPINGSVGLVLRSTSKIFERYNMKLLTCDATDASSKMSIECSLSTTRFPSARLSEKRSTRIGALCAAAASLIALSTPISAEAATYLAGCSSAGGGTTVSNTNCEFTENPSSATPKQGNQTLFTSGNWAYGPIVGVSGVSYASNSGYAASIYIRCFVNSTYTKTIQYPAQYKCE